MFWGATEFNGNITDWDTSNVTNMKGMFRDTVTFNCDIGSWVVSSVENMSLMFRDTEAFDQDIGSWDVRNVTDMNGMFESAEEFNQDISSWNVSSVTTMIRMFFRSNNFNQDLRQWEVDSEANLTQMFRDSVFKDGDYYTWYSDPQDWKDGHTPLSTYFNQSSGNICFLGSEKVETDQGKIRFDELTTDHTIFGQKIKQVVKVINSDDNLIFIRKHAFAKKVPSQNTYISRNHGVYIDDSIIQEKDLEPQFHPLFYHIDGKNLVRARNLIKMRHVT